MADDTNETHPRGNTISTAGRRITLDPTLHGSSDLIEHKLSVADIRSLSDLIFNVNTPYPRNELTYYDFTLTREPVDRVLTGSIGQIHGVTISPEPSLDRQSHCVNPGVYESVVEETWKAISNQRAKDPEKKPWKNPEDLRTWFFHQGLAFFRSSRRVLRIKLNDEVQDSSSIHKAITTKIQEFTLSNPMHAFPYYLASPREPQAWWEKAINNGQALYIAVFTSSQLGAYKMKLTQCVRQLDDLISSGHLKGGMDFVKRYTLIDINRLYEKVERLIAKNEGMKRREEQKDVPTLVFNHQGQDYGFYLLDSRMKLKEEGAIQNNCLFDDMLDSYCNSLSGYTGNKVASIRPLNGAVSYITAEFSVSEEDARVVLTAGGAVIRLNIEFSDLELKNNKELKIRDWEVITSMMKTFPYMELNCSMGEFKRRAYENK